MFMLYMYIRIVLLLSQITVSLFGTYVQGTSQKMKAAQFEVGGPEKMYIGEVPVPALREKEILIKVYASAINRADTLQRKGLYPVPAGESLILGLEAAGVVDVLGPGASKWKVGDRVMALVSGGGNAEFVTAHEDHVMVVPNDMTFTTAAAIPEVWLTAYQLLHKVAGLQSGETVLIHAGGSGVGTAAVQLVRLAQAIPIVTAGTTAKLDMAKGLGAEHGFNYKEGPFTNKVLEATNGRGVDVILDCVGGSFWEQNLDSLALDGRWIMYGLMGGASVNGDLLAKVLRKRASLIGSTLRSRSVKYKGELLSSFTTNALPNFASGQLKTIIDTILPLDQIGQAHSTMESNKNAGKIVLQVREEKQEKSEL